MPRGDTYFVAGYFTDSGVGSIRFWTSWKSHPSSIDMPRKFKSLNAIEAEEARQARAVVAQWADVQQQQIENQRDSSKLVAHVLKELARPSSILRGFVNIGVPLRTTWPPGNHDHVPMALEQLRAMNVQCKALPVCQPLDPL